VHFIRGGVGEYVFDKGNLNCSIRHVTLLKILKKIDFIFALISIRNLPYQFLLVSLSKLMFLLPILDDFELSQAIIYLHSIDEYDFRIVCKLETQT